jgi:hypothetical protein
LKSVSLTPDGDQIAKLFRHPVLQFRKSLEQGLHFI